MTEVIDKQLTANEFRLGNLPDIVCSNAAFFLHLMSRITDSRECKERSIEDAKLILLYSGKDCIDKLQYGLKLAVMSMGAYIQSLGATDPVTLFSKEYEARGQVTAGIETLPLYYSVIVTRLTTYLYVNMMGLDATKLQVFSVDGNCWISYICLNAEGRYHRVQFCIDDIMIDFFTPFPPIDRHPIVESVIKLLPYRFLLSKEELKFDGPPGQEDDLVEPWEIIENTIDNYVQPFLSQLNFVDKVVDAEYKKVKAIAVDYLRTDKFL